MQHTVYNHAKLNKQNCSEVMRPIDSVPINLPLHINITVLTL